MKSYERSIWSALFVSGTLMSASVSAPVFADPADWVSVPMSEGTLDLSRAETADFRYDGSRDAFCLQGEAFVRDLSIGDGSVAVDIRNNHHRHFAYVLFRVADRNTFESAYLRMHKSGQADALQYTPFFNREPNWQLFGEQQASANFGTGDWLTLTIDYKETWATITVSTDDGPQAQIKTKLSVSGSGGGIGLATLFEGCFSNLRVRETSPDKKPSAPRPNEAKAASNFQTIDWSLSDAYRIESWQGLDTKLDPAPNWEQVPNEPNGRLLISRFRRKAIAGRYRNNSLDQVFAGTAIHARTDTRATLAIDASDQAVVFLNGDPIFAFNNAFRAKGPLFRGDINRHGQLITLPLKAGRNELIAGIADRANGWGLSAALETGEKVRITPIGEQ